MISINQWLNKKIQYEENYFLKDVFDIIINKVYNYLIQTDLEITCDYRTFKEDFMKDFYDYYLNHKQIQIYDPDFDLENFDFLHGTEIFEIYKEIQEITRFYNLDYFHGYQESYVDIMNFIINHIHFAIKEYDENDENDENDDLYVEEHVY